MKTYKINKKINNKETICWSLTSAAKFIEIYLTLGSTTESSE